MAQTAITGLFVGVPAIALAVDWLLWRRRTRVVTGAELNRHLFSNLRRL